MLKVKTYCYKLDTHVIISVTTFIGNHSIKIKNCKTAGTYACKLVGISKFLSTGNAKGKSD